MKTNVKMDDLHHAVRSRLSIFDIKGGICLNSESNIWDYEVRYSEGKNLGIIFKKLGGTFL